MSSEGGSAAFLQTEAAWEARWAPHDEDTYQAVMSNIRPDDVVLDIGAGDLRLATRMARVARLVFAIELQEQVLRQPGSTFGDMGPPNLSIICGDAREIPFPEGVTLGVLLMRHCQNYAHYVNKLRTVRCSRLVTNARWRTGIEVVDLKSQGLPFEKASPGWYACCCGATGFIPSPPEELTSEMLDQTLEVANCPACTNWPISSSRL